MSTSTPAAGQVGDVLISTIAKNARAELRIALTEFRGHRLVQIREWFIGEEGEWRPGKGASFKVGLLPIVAHGINQALERARADGLL